MNKTDGNLAGVLSASGAGDYGDRFGAADGFRPRRFVGVFYCQWLGYEDLGVMAGEKNVDALYYGENARAHYRADVLGDGRDAEGKTRYRYWGKPMYGYYRADDEWVIRRHLQLLTLAGVDFLAMDTTNAATFDGALEVLLNCIAEYRAGGLPVPQVFFFTNTRSAETVLHLYERFYTRQKYADCWFRGCGEKPWITCNFDGGTEEQKRLIRDYFYVKPAQWPTEPPRENGFPWIDWEFPLHPYYDEQLRGNIYAVSIAQHAGLGRYGIHFSDSAYARLLLGEGLDVRNSQGKTPDEIYNVNRGRGFDFDGEKNAYGDEGRILRNENFRRQWESPLGDADAALVLVLGWNEWIAGNWPREGGYDGLGAIMCDLVNLEFSRDIEMMAEGGHSYADNCYLQMCGYIRSFKCEGEGKAFADAKNRAVTPAAYVEAEWAGATEFKTFPRSCEARDTADCFGERAVNAAGRADLLSIKAAHDEENVYFLLTAADVIPPREEGDDRYMNLFLGTGEEGGWNGLNYVLNRSSSGGKTSLHRIREGKFEEIPDAGCTCVAAGNRLLFSLPRRALGIAGSAFRLQLKAADNLQKDFDVTALYASGEVVPLGRINFVYRAE